MSQPIFIFISNEAVATIAAEVITFSLHVRTEQAFRLHVRTSLTFLLHVRTEQTFRLLR